MIFRVVDTNVAVVANKKAPQAGPDCVMACVEELRRIIKSGGVVIDDRMRILQEYMGNLSPAGQPGPGDAFMKWIWRNQANTSCCEQVSITADASREFAEFPKDPRLAGFHRSDRKFVAVALASQKKPEILNAVDKHWWDNRQALDDCGVKVRFLCPSHFPRKRNK